MEVSTSKVVGPPLHSERIEEQIGDTVPPFVEDTVEVGILFLRNVSNSALWIKNRLLQRRRTTLNIASKEIPQERLLERIEEQVAGILVPPTMEEIVQSVQIVQERFQQSIEEQMVDHKSWKNSSLPRRLQLLPLIWMLGWRACTHCMTCLWQNALLLNS